MRVGDKIYFAEEVRPYIIKAMGFQYAICTKPFNLKHTVLYTIVDFKEKIRGTNYFVFNPYDYAIQDDIDQCLKDLGSGETEISYRNRIELKINRVVSNQVVIKEGIWEAKNLSFVKMKNATTAAR